MVSRGYAIALLEEMRDCRPPPPFEEHDAVFSIGFDQTYVSGAAASTGSASRYRTLKTLHADGTARLRTDERMVYINGQHWATPSNFPFLSAADRAVLAAHGPYTQDFVRVLPIMQPQQSQAFMDDMLDRTSVLLAPLLTSNAGAQNLDAVSVLRALLSRPNVDPGGPTYMTYLKPLLECDTKSYEDMKRCEARIGVACVCSPRPPCMNGCLLCPL